VVESSSGLGISSDVNRDHYIRKRIRSR
jgi:hypothetical protein